MPIDPELLPAYARLISSAPPDLERLSILRAEDAAEVPPLTDLCRSGRFDVIERTTDDAPGVPMVICTPTGSDADRPVLFHIHGGGFFSGDHRVGLDAFLDEAEWFGATLVSVGYRLAPEHPYPAQIDDVQAALHWVIEHAHDLGVSRNRVVLVGTSAGGGLAAALALRLRDVDGPRPLGQLLLSPMLDDRNDSPSVLQMEGRDIWDRTWNGFAWTTLLGEEQGGMTVPADAAPSRATDLVDVPPAFLEVGSAESLRDEVVDYVRRIWAAGGDAELHIWTGGYHVFDWEAPSSRIGVGARAARRSWLTRLLQHHPSGPSDDG